MRFLALLIPLLLLFTIEVMSSTSPYPAWLPQYIKDPSLPKKDGVHLRRQLHTKYDVSYDGGGVGVHAIPGYLPLNAIVTRSIIAVKTQLTAPSGNTVALSCQAANDIKTATDMTGTAANGFVEGAQTGTTATMVKITSTAGCPMAVTVGGTALSTGYLDFFIDYTITN